MQALLDIGNIMIMTDKDWLERVTIAYKAYPYPSKDIEAFVQWMYKQYGIVQPKEDKNGR